ncbi:MAG: PrsW family glutamic-type intramembrane protease [Patescibacteria group bacterium]
MNNLNILFALLASFLPAFGWLLLIFYFRKREKKKLQVLTFLIGALSVMAVFAIQSLLLTSSDYNLEHLLTDTFKSSTLFFMIFFGVMGSVEEICKYLVVRILDKKFSLIQTINISIIFSVTAALGFAFLENFIYFYTLFSEGLLDDFYTTFIFRAIYTTLGHVLFAAIFGYYYGVSKFSQTILTQEKILGKVFKITKIIEKVTHGTLHEIYQQQKIIKGLLLASIFHMFFNFFIQWQQMWLVFLLLTAMFLYVAYLFQTKTGHLVFLETRAKSPFQLVPSNQLLLGKLLDMWHVQKYDEVEKICNDILLIDPLNDTVKLFRAQAQDKKSIQKVTKIFTS